MRAVGEQDRTRLRHRHRQTVRHGTSSTNRRWTPRWRCCALSKRYSAQRLENACSLALQSVASPRYAHIGPILESGQDIAGEIPDDAGDHGADGGDDGAVGCAAATVTRTWAGETQ